jgi:hypothetical protein
MLTRGIHQPMIEGFKARQLWKQSWVPTCQIIAPPQWKMYSMRTWTRLFLSVKHRLARRTFSRRMSKYSNIPHHPRLRLHIISKLEPHVHIPIRLVNPPSRFHQKQIIPSVDLYGCLLNLPSSQPQLLMIGPHAHAPYPLLTHAVSDCHI